MKFENKKLRSLWIALHLNPHSDLVLEKTAKQFSENITALFAWDKKIKNLFSIYETSDTYLLPKKLRFENVTHFKMALKYLYQIIFNAAPYLQYQISELSCLNLAPYGAILPSRMKEKFIVTAKITIDENTNLLEENYQSYGLDIQKLIEYMEILTKTMIFHLDKKKEYKKHYNHLMQTKDPLLQKKYTELFSFDEFVKNYFYRFCLSKIRHFSLEFIHNITMKIKHQKGDNEFKKIQFLCIVAYLLYRDTTYDEEKFEKMIENLLTSKSLEENFKKDEDLFYLTTDMPGWASPFEYTLRCIRASENTFSTEDILTCIEIFFNFSFSRATHIQSTIKYFFNAHFYKNAYLKSYLRFHISLYKKCLLREKDEDIVHQVAALTVFSRPYGWYKNYVIRTPENSTLLILNLLCYFNFSECYSANKNYIKYEDGSYKYIFDISLFEKFFENKYEKLKELLSYLAEFEFSYLTLTTKWDDFKEFFNSFSKQEKINFFLVEDLLKKYYSNNFTIKSKLNSHKEKSEHISKELGENPKLFIRKFKKEGLKTLDKINDSNFSLYAICFQEEASALISNVCETCSIQALNKIKQHFSILFSKSSSAHELKRNASLLYYFLQTIEMSPKSNFFIDHLIENYITYSQDLLKNGDDFYERIAKIANFKLFKTSVLDLLLDIESLELLSEIEKMLKIAPEQYHCDLVVAIKKQDVKFATNFTTFLALVNEKIPVKNIMRFILKILNMRANKDSNITSLLNIIHQELFADKNIDKLTNAIVFLNMMLSSQKESADYGKALEKLLQFPEIDNVFQNFNSNNFYSVTAFLNKNNIGSYTDLIEEFTRECLKHAEEENYDEEKISHNIKEIKTLDPKKTILLNSAWAQAIQYFVEFIYKEKTKYRNMSLSKLLEEYKNIKEKGMPLCRFNDFLNKKKEIIENTIHLLALQFEISCQLSYNGEYFYPYFVQQIIIIFCVLSDRHLFLQIDASQGKTLIFQHLIALKLHEKHTVIMLTDRILLSQRDFKHSRSFLTLLGYRTSDLLDISTRDTYQEGGAHFTTSHEVNNFISRQEQEYFQPKSKQKEIFTFKNPTTILIDEFDRSSDDTPAVVSESNKSITEGILSQKTKQDYLKKFYEMIIKFVDEPKNITDNPRNDTQKLWDSLNEIDTSFLTKEKVFYELYVLMISARQSHFLFELDKEVSLVDNDIYKIDNIESKYQRVIGIQNRLPRKNLKFSHGAHQFLVIRKMKAQLQLKDTSTFPLNLPLEEITIEHKNILYLIIKAKDSGGILITASATLPESLTPIEDLENYFDLLACAVPKRQIVTKSLLTIEAPLFISINDSQFIHQQGHDYEEEELFKAIAKDILEKQKNERPVLIIFESTKKCEALLKFLNEEKKFKGRKNNIQKYTAEDTLTKKPKTILKKAGKEYAITISNIMSIGFDIPIKEEIAQNGGLHVIIAEPLTETEAFQGQRRAGRKCQGSTKTIVCCENQEAYASLQREKLAQLDLKRKRNFYKSKAGEIFKPICTENKI